MTHQNLPSETVSSTSIKFMAILLLLFVGSGCSALIYEIVWFQLLQLVVGSSAVSLGVLLGTFMGGLCLGSVSLSHVVSARRHPLRVYAALELGIGLIGLLLLLTLPHMGQLYTAFVGSGLWGILFRAGVSAVFLLPPTVLMGATLPAIARWVETTQCSSNSIGQGVSWLGFFYGANIAGGVFGCLLAGFYLLRVHDLAVATYLAAAINVSVAVIGLGLASVTRHREVDNAPREVRDSEQRGALSLTSSKPSPKWSVYATIALSGMSALGAEVIWTRLLSLMLGATVYTFSVILAVFLVGLGIGSSVGSMLVRGRRATPRVALGICQLLLTGAIAWTAYALTRSLPYWPIDVSIPTTPWIYFQLDLMRCAWAMLPAACLWGASFPLALAGAASQGQDPGRLVGGVYAANTVGAIAGALLFSMLMIPWIGTQRAQQVLIAISAAAALLMLAPAMWSFRHTQRTDKRADEPRFPGFRFAQPNAILASLGLIAMFELAALFIWSVPQVPSGLVAYGRYLPTQTEMPQFHYVGEGINASIAVTELPNGVRSFHVSGKVVASSGAQDMRLQRMLCHLPALIHPGPKSALVVGCGAGVTAGSFVVYPDIERIVICELEPLIPPFAGEYFGVENYNVMADPRVKLVYDDARHYVMTTDEKFDIITSDPIHPWVKGAATLYTKEYFERCKQRLNPGGVVSQWVPLYETNLPAVRSQLATFFQVFPNGTIWSNDVDGKGYDIVLLSQPEATKIDPDALQRRLEREDHLRVLASLDEVNLGSALRLLKTYAGRASDLQTWVNGAELNRDINLRLQYLAGMGLNAYESESIYEEILAFRRYPEELFVATRIRGRALRAFLERPKLRE
jgi:spermidine synthase